MVTFILQMEGWDTESFNHQTKVPYLARRAFTTWLSNWHAHHPICGFSSAARNFVGILSSFTGQHLFITGIPKDFVYLLDIGHNWCLTRTWSSELKRNKGSFKWLWNKKGNLWICRVPENKIRDFEFQFYGHVGILWISGWFSCFYYYERTLVYFNK